MGIQTVHKKHSDFKFMRGYCIIKRTESSKAVSVRGLTMFDTVVCHDIMVIVVALVVHHLKFNMFERSWAHDQR